MDEIVQAQMNALVQQRDQALNNVIHLIGELAKIAKELRELKESLEKPDVAN